MGIANIATAVSIFLAGLVPTSCHQTSPQQKTPAPAQGTVAVAATSSPAGEIHPVATDTVLHNLGDVALTNHLETCVQLGGGKNCIVSPRMLDSHNVQITFSLECRTNAGKIRELSVGQVVTTSGKSVEIALGNFNLTLTPRMAVE